MSEISPQQWASNLLATPDNYCILDTETTGLQGAEPVDIGVIDLFGNVLVSLRVKPSIPINKGATHIHGITNEAVKDAPSFASVYHEFWRSIGNRTLLIYNAAYDIQVLKNAHKVHGVGFPSFIEYQCVMLQYSEFIGDWNDYHGNYKWQKLPSGDHSAIGDCRATLKVIQEMASDDN